MTRVRISDSTALAAWIGDAQLAVDLGHLLTPDMLLALSALPEREFSLRNGVSWFLEEWSRIRREAERDVRPLTGVRADVQAWQHRDDMRAEQMQGLARDHVQCIAKAHAFLAGELAAQQRDATRIGRAA